VTNAPKFDESAIDAAVMARLRAPFGCEYVKATGNGLRPDLSARWCIYDANDDVIASVSHREEGYARLIVQALNEHYAMRVRPTVSGSSEEVADLRAK
jgi:hypothetical protein